MAKLRSPNIRLPPDEAHTYFGHVRTKAGASIDTAQVVWAIRDCGATIRIDHSAYPATEGLSHSAKRVLQWQVENHATSSVRHSYCNLLALLRHERDHLGKPVEEITAATILRYRSSLTVQTEPALGRIRSLFRRWHDMGLPGLSPTALDVFDEIVFQHPTSGGAILTMDPVNGAFTSIEAATIHAALEEAYDEGRIVLENYLIAVIFPLLGQRPVQVASLKVCDLLTTEATATQSGQYFLNIPRAKQRGTSARSQFKTRRLHRQFGQRLALHAEDVMMRFAEQLEDPSQAPLFPAKRKARNAPPGWEYHRTGGSMSMACRKIFKNIPAKSERTEDKLNVCPIRFRRTVGTRAAEAGYGELVIAELLDHTDTQSVSVYVEATSTIRDRIDHAVATQLAPLVNAFRGSLRLNEADDKSRGDSVAGVFDPRFDQRPMGGCAHHGQCELLAPLECYTCAYYRPWATAPHENVLDYLVKERKRLREKRAPTVATSLDRTILAVAEVIALVKSVNQSGSNHG